ncbi:MAG TPA: IS4 family transposase, partial [Candidatus Methylomirabilis sp.]|nr:IS4 family transposase [Candidatus Methylomirabilis sp.]
TFVERSTKTGTSLSAANWRRVGQSQGRGRGSPSAKVRSKTVKDVWVFELEGQSRQSLRCCPESRVVPRSLFHGASTECWVNEELDGLELGDRRLEKRFARMLQSRWKRPDCSFFRSFGSVAAGKGAYRLIESREAEVTFENLLAPHRQQTQRRMAAERLVFLPQDTTALSYNGLRKAKGLGPVGDKDNPGRGLWLHSMQAFRLDGIPLGCAWAKLWAREPESDTAKRNEQSVAQKESGRWLEAYQAAARLARSMPQTHLIVGGDRESDIFELFDQTTVAEPNLHLLVRAQHDRMLSEGGKLFKRLLEQPVGGTMQVRVPRREKRPARVATLELRWARIEAAPPRVALKKSWQPIPLYAVLAQEINPPAGQEPIQWALLTDWKVESLKMAIRLVRWYSLRWGIECWHQSLKDVCRVEKRQMESNVALERALVLDMVVAWRALMLCRLGQVHPAWKASFFYSGQELAVLEVYRERLPEHARSGPDGRPPPGVEEQEDQLAQQCAAQEGLPPPVPAGQSASNLTLFQANFLVAMFAGFWGRKSDGHPGPKLMAQGLMILAALVEDRQLAARAAAQATFGPKRSRKPG